MVPSFIALFVRDGLTLTLTVWSGLAKEGVTAVVVFSVSAEATQNEAYTVCVPAA